MKFAKVQLENKLYDNVVDELVSTSRWSIQHYLVFKHEDKFYETHYSTGATENQDEGPWEYEDDPIECQEVEAYQKTVTAYRAVK